MKVRFNQEDLDKGKLVTPGWYSAKVLTVEEKPAETDGSMNWNYKLSIVGSEFNGVPVYRTFNEKGKGYMIRFIESLGGRVTAGTEFDPQRAIGKILRIFIKNELYQNNMRNNVADFMQADSPQPQPELTK